MLSNLELAKSETTNPDVLKVLMKDENKDVRRFIALNRNTPKETLLELAKIKNYDIVVAMNPNAPSEVLRDVYNKYVNADSKGFIVNLISMHPNAPMDIKALASLEIANA